MADTEIKLVIIKNHSLLDILTSASASHKNEIDEELQMIKAVQESMLQWKIRSSKRRQKRQASMVCYGDLGCFEDSGPFGYIDMLPQSPEEIDTKFYVFSTKNRFVDGCNFLHNTFQFVLFYHFQIRQSIPSILIPRHFVIQFIERNTNNDDHPNPIQSKNG